MSTPGRNRLIEETSPYLLQHADNPVDWYPWGDEALARAQQEDKPILLSIGYSACHWCHVMERESFEDPAIAALMNESFVCIKVDREERPDVDAIYMDAVQVMTGHGGWPMTVFLNPQGVPFFGGTYFPPDDRHGLPSFRRVLQGVVDVWKTRRHDAIRQGESLLEHLRSMASPPPSREPLHESLFGVAVQGVLENFDERYGGFGGPPKFPQAPVLELLLRAVKKGHAQVRGPLDFTLQQMAMGGIYDHIGGGFHRYSVDQMWLVPHFEKMLYDNAQLAAVYTHAWQLWKSDLFARIAIETLEYLLRDMRHTGGAFFSSEDADSEGIEGKFYVWDYDSFMSTAPEAADHYGVTKLGNFEGLNILTAKVTEVPKQSRLKLYDARIRRVRPGLDDKILTSWNGLAIGALAEAGAALGRGDFIDAAGQAADFLTQSVRASNGRLLHSYKDGVAKVNGLLEDYAFLSHGLLLLWEATFDKRWLDSATVLADQMVDFFWDEAAGGFFTTSSDHESLIVRQKEITESATPSANAVASLVLQRLAVLLGNQDYSRKGADSLRVAAVYMDRAPQASASSLSAVDFYTSVPKEIAIVGDVNSEKGSELIAAVWQRFIPNRVLASDVEGLVSPLLEGKTPTNGKPTAFVCERYECKSPTTDPRELAAQLD